MKAAGTAGTQAPGPEVEDLDDTALLAAATAAERRDREAQRDKLRIAYRWCLRHPATLATGTATWGDAGLPGLADCDAPLGGEGTPAVAAFAAEPSAPPSASPPTPPWA